MFASCLLSLSDCGNDGYQSACGYTDPIGSIDDSRLLSLCHIPAAGDTV